MVCRACGKEERASEGYPCVDCGTFLCMICDLRGVTRCAACEAAARTRAETAVPPPPPPAAAPLLTRRP